MKLFITGATGFVGCALAHSLARDGAEIHALVRPTSDRSVLDGFPVRFHEGDVTAPETFLGLLDQATHVVHSAGRLGEAGVPEETYRRVHADGTRNLLRAALAAKVQRVLHISTPGVLGPTLAEAAREDAPYAPDNPYERTKAEAEKIALEFASRGLPVVIARPAFLYGPGDHHVLRLFQAVQRGRFLYVDGGRHLCHPTFIDDAVDGMTLALTHGQAGSIYQFAGPRAVTFREFGSAVAAALGVPAPRVNLPGWLVRGMAEAFEALSRVTRRAPPLSRTGAAFFSQDRHYSCQKARQELGYSPAIDLPEGLARTVGWYRERGYL